MSIMKKKMLHFIWIVQLFISCDCSFSGVHNLGNNLVLLEGDKMEDRVVVYCRYMKDKCCSGGLPVIPSNGVDHMTRKGYVELAVSDGKWVILKSSANNGKESQYWIIDKRFNIDNINCDSVDCDSILHSFVIGPLSKDTFELNLKNKSIELHFEY